MKNSRIENYKELVENILYKQFNILFIELETDQLTLARWLHSKYLQRILPYQVVKTIRQKYLKQKLF